jgi:hypothetical protein
MRLRKSIRITNGRGRHRRRLGLAALLLLVVGWGCYEVLTAPRQIRRLCLRYLAQSLDGDISIRSATFSLFGGIHLEGVRVTEPAPAAESPSAPRPFFYCSNLLLKHSPLALLTGRLVVDEVVAVNPVCNLVRSDETGEYNVSRILRRPPPGRPAQRPTFPAVHLRNASLIVARDHGGQPHEVERLNVSISATPVAGTPGAYALAWQRGGPEPARGRSLFDLRSLSVKDQAGGLPWLSLETSMLVVARQVPEAERWFGLLGLGGHIKADNYDLSFRGDATRRTRLTLRLRDASLSIPGDELERPLPREQRYLRFENVEGTVELSAASAALQFTGLFHGARCRVTAALEGPIGPQAHLDDVGLTATITCDDLPLPIVDDPASPDAVRFVERWRTLRSFYNDFDPHGRVALELSLTKPAGAGQPFRFDRGVMNVLNADASYRQFPYRVRNITGSVEVTPDGIYLRRLAGDHAGHPVVVDGWLAEARWYAASKLHITGDHIDLDRDLHQALNERYRRLWDAFELGGTADITVDMIRPPGTEAEPRPYATSVDAVLTDARACYSGFAYPVEGLSGRVTIAGDRLRVTQLAAETGVSGVRVDGYADLTQGGLADLNLRVDAHGIAFDDRLAAALSDDTRQQVSRFAPQGVFDLTGTLFLDPQTRGAAYDLAVALRDVQMTYRALPVPIDHVSGTVRLQPRRITVEHMTGQRGTGAVTADGDFAVGPGSGAASAVIACDHLEADNELLDALPENIGRFCRDLRVLGPVRTVTRFARTGAAEEEGEFRTTIDVADITLCPAAFPYPLQTTGGTVVVEPGRVEVQDFRARHGETDVSLQGAVTLGDDLAEGTFVLSARKLALDEDLRLAVPWRWRRTWNNLSPTGRVDLELNELRYRSAAATAPEWDFAGRLLLNSIGLDVGVVATDVVGVLAGQGQLRGLPGELTATAELSCDSALLNRRRVEGIRARLEQSAADRRLALSDVSGAIYGGFGTADVQVYFDSDATRYDVTTTLQDVDLGRFLRVEPTSAPRFAAVSGTLDAHLYLNGASGNLETRRGGGRVQVHEGDLYRLPLMLAILDGMGSRVPEESAIQELAADFYVTGSRMEINDLIFQGASLALAGSGTLVPATGIVALDLVSVTPRKWTKVPVLTEMLEGASRELMQIDINGPVSDPVITTRPLRGVEVAVETLFEKKKPKPAAPKPEHPPRRSP